MGLALALALAFALAHICHAQNSPQDFLDAHNAARAEVGVGNMSWENTVAAYAHNYADQRIADCRLKHSDGPYGENVAWGINLTGTDAVSLWLGEKQFYDYDSNSCIGGQTCKLYTQIVWRYSVRLGCATVQCNDGQWFIQCNYDPRGNLEGLRPYTNNSDTNYICFLDIY